MFTLNIGIFQNSPAATVLSGFISVVSEEEKQSETEQPPTEESLVQMKHPKHIRIIYHDPDESSGDEDDDINSIEDENDDDDMGDEEKVKLIMYIFN